MPSSAGDSQNSVSLEVLAALVTRLEDDDKDVRIMAIMTLRWLSGDKMRPDVQGAIRYVALNDLVRRYGDLPVTRSRWTKARTGLGATSHMFRFNQQCR